MTNTQINHIIHEAKGLCWHAWVSKCPSVGCLFHGACKHCGIKYFDNFYTPDYTSDWSAYGEALEWAQMQKWWTDFAYKVRQILPTHYIMASFLQDDLLIPIKGSTALAEFIVAHLEFFKKEVEK